MPAQKANVLIVGSGPAGLAAAIELRRLGVDDVLVLEREQQAGGVPRHSNHIGFGWRDMRRFMFGPDYAERYVRLAEHTGVRVQTGVSVTNWVDETSVMTTSRSGRRVVQANAVILATGCRERPRTTRMIAGSRPAGVFTTGSLQQFVYTHHHPVGKRAVVVGAEHVSFSAVMTLKHAGCDVAAMVTEHQQHQTFLPYKFVSADRFGVPIMTNTRVIEIMGKGRVEAVTLEHIHSRGRQEVACDTVVFTGNWIPNNELARAAELAMNRGTNGPAVDQCLRTTAAGVFAAGNLLHGAETADVAALSGRYVAPFVKAFLRNGAREKPPLIPIVCESPLVWISPNMVDRTCLDIPHNHFILRTSSLVSNCRLDILQGDRRLWSQRFRKIIPNIPIHLNHDWLLDVADSCEAIVVKVNDDSNARF